MEVASPELCKQLFELSGWECGNWYGTHSVVPDGFLKPEYETTPAYSLGFILRKLPPRFIGQDKDTRRLKWLSLMPYEDFETTLPFWMACYRSEVDYLPSHINKADTPENAACKLTIELFQQGILKRKGDDV